MSKQVTRLVLSIALLVVLGGIAFTTEERSLSGVAIVFAVILGVPFLILSLIDLGKILRSANNGNYKASKVTWFLSQSQAAFGSVCIAVAGYALYYNLSAWYNGNAEFHGAMLFIWIPIGLGMMVIGFNYIWTAFVPENIDEINDNDT